MIHLVRLIGFTVALGLVVSALGLGLAGSVVAGLLAVGLSVLAV